MTFAYIRPTSIEPLTTTDQLKNTIEINFPPQRIISLVPSQTELLFDLGLDEEIVGITRFCIHPAEKVKGKTKIGGTKKFDLEKIKSLQPDLIIGNKEENYQEGIEELQKHFPVWMSDIYTLEDAYAMMLEVSKIVDREREGKKLIEEIRGSFAGLGSGPGPGPESPGSNPAPDSGQHGSGFASDSGQQGNVESGQRKKTAAYFIWRKPYMVAAGNTFIDHMLQKFGVQNVFKNETRYPEIDPKVLAQVKPDLIFLSSEPYRFTEKHFDEFRSFSPTSQVLVVDGELFSWYGSRLRFAAKYFMALRATLAT